MRTDARSIFIVSLLLFIVVTGWRVWVALRPLPPAAPSPPAATPPRLDRYQPLGIMNFVSNQFSAETLVIPVNPFRPTFETMVLNPGSGDLQAVVEGSAHQPQTPAAVAGAGSEGGGREGGGRGGRWPSFNRGQRVTGGRSGGDEGPPEIPRYYFAGVFERTDGKVAAYVRSTTGSGRFLLAGDRFDGCEVVAAGHDGVMLRTPEGKELRMGPGDAPMELTGK